MSAPTPLHPALQPLVLLSEHRHSGRLYPAGAVLQLPAHKAQWLIAQGVAAAAPAAVPAAKETKPTKE